MMVQQRKHRRAFACRFHLTASRRIREFRAGLLEQRARCLSRLGAFLPAFRLRIDG